MNPVNPINNSPRRGFLNLKTAFLKTVALALGLLALSCTTPADRTTPPETGSRTIPADKTPPPETGKLFTATLPDGTELEMVAIPAGDFLMGSPESDYRNSSNETQHPVRISKPFWLGKYEVTQGQWMSLMSKNPSWFKESGEKVPVENVSWEDAMAFCKKLTERERSAGRLPAGYVYTLPTEAQWEYACRAGTTTAFNTGSNITTEQANYVSRTLHKGNVWWGSRHGTMPVGSFSPNAWGLYDMHGNVKEWCRDASDGYKDYSLHYEKTEKGRIVQTEVDPLQTAGSERILRGGGWDSVVNICRSASRIGLTPNNLIDNLGFRVALAPESVR